MALRNIHTFHPLSPIPDLRCDPFLLGMQKWLQQIGDRVFALKLKVHNLRFPPDNSWKDRYDELAKKPQTLSLEDLDL